MSNLFDRGNQTEASNQDSWKRRIRNRMKYEILTKAFKRKSYKVFLWLKKNATTSTEWSNLPIDVQQ
jgi:hypothetical protein